MAPEGVKRKISAILSADVVGYSRLMEADEEATVRTVETYRKTVTSLISQHDGRVIDSPGDNILSEFASVVDAVQCAVEIQHVIRAKNAGLPEARKMEFRIGINLGDVIQEEGRVYGDGINIAARIEGLADAGGICISDSAYQQIETKLALGYIDLGEHTVKNISKPVRVYRIPMGTGDSLGAASEKDTTAKRWRNVAIGAVAALVIVVGFGFIIFQSSVPKPPSPPEAAKHEAASASLHEDRPLLSERPAIAVLPFENISDDPKQEYFVDGMTEEIISRLSMNPFLTVIARNSTFFYKGKQTKIQQIGKELGARYVVEGSVRKANTRVRITAQLIDASSGGHIWAETYDREYEDIFALQDEIAQQITASLTAHGIVVAEQARAKRKPTDNLTAYDNMLRATAAGMKLTRKGYTEAKVYLEEAIEQDPDFAVAHLWLGVAYAMLSWEGSQNLERGFESIRKAISLDDRLSSAHAWLGNLYRWRGQLEKAKAEAQRALELNPNDDFSYLITGTVLRDSGQPQEAVEYIEKSMRLNPHHAANYFTELALAYAALGLYEKMIDPLQKAIVRDPQWMHTYALFAFAYRSLGKNRQAIEWCEEGISQDPDNAGPYRNLAWSYLFLWGTQQDRDTDLLDKALEAAQKSVALGPNDAYNHNALCDASLVTGQYDQAVSEAEKAAAIHPGWSSLLGHVYNHIGRVEEAIELAEKALQLNPREIGSLHTLAHAYRLAGRHEKAIELSRSILDRPHPYSEGVRNHLNLAISYSELDCTEEAKAEAAGVLKLVPDFSVDVWGERNPMKDRDQVERDMAALRKAGLK